MAKRQEITKTQAVRDYLKAHPRAKSSEIAEALTKEGIKIKASHVANIKSNLKRMRLAKKAARAKPVAVALEARGAATEPVSAATEKAIATGGTVALEHVKTVAQTVKAMGGFDRLNELLGVIKAVGGIKRFKDLLEAMAATEMDKIPF